MEWARGRWWLKAEEAGAREPLYPSGMTKRLGAKPPGASRAPHKTSFSPHASPVTWVGTVIIALHKRGNRSSTSCHVLHEAAEPRMDLPAKPLLFDALLNIRNMLHIHFKTLHTAHCPLSTWGCMVNLLCADLKTTLFLPPLLRRRRPRL